MRIEQLRLEAYGHYQDAVLDLSSPERGLTVVYGPNEAGKSTARRALIAALFGVERTTPDAHRFGVHALRLGARLRGAAGTSLSYLRQGLSGLAHHDGAPMDAAVLDRLLGGVDEVAYSRLFAIDHDELRRGSESLLDADGEIGRLVFGASLGSGSVVAVLRRLDERAAVLYKDKGSAQRIPRALKAYRDGMRQAKESRVRARDWDRLRQDVDDATARLDDVRNAFEKARAEQLRLGRVRAARPIVARRRVLAYQLDELGKVVPSSSAERVSDALARYREALAARERAAAQRQGLADQVAGIEVPHAVLAVATTVDELVEGIGRYRKDIGDLPKRRTELDAALRSVRVQLQRLGKASDDGRVVAESDLVALEGLARQESALSTEARAADIELRRARDRATDCSTRLADAPEPADVGGLSRVLELVRPKVETARALAGERAEHHAATKDIAHRAARLGLGSLGPDQLEALEVPPSVDVDAERDRRHAHRLQLAQIDRELEAQATELTAIERQVEAASVQAPQPERLGTARAHRDEGWRVVRAMLEGEPADATWADGRPLADAYERAVADADAAADERYDHADALATVIQLRAQRDEIVRKGEVLHERRRSLLDTAGGASAAWAALWSAVGVEARSPEAMTEWLREQREVVAAIGRLRHLEARIAGATEDVEGHATDLGTALAGVGEDPCSEQLDLLVVQASEVVERARDAAAERRAARAELELAEREALERTAALEQARQRLEEWRASWVTALGPLGLGPSTTTEAAMAAVAAHRGLATARSDVASLERRIEGIRDDCHRYEERVEAAAAAVLGDDHRSTPLSAVPELQRRARHARDAQQQRHAIEGRLQEAETGLRLAELELESGGLAIDRLRREMGLPAGDGAPDAGLDEIVIRAREAAALQQRLAEADDALLDQSAGFDVHQLEAEVLATGDVLDGRLDALSAEVDTLQKELEAANGDLADARRALAAVTEAATAADLEQEAETELALAASCATEYARTALAAEVLRRAVAEYGERHRGPLLGRAADLLRLLTVGAFVDLAVDADGDRRVLLAQRAGGELCPVAALSDGTRDQLYLALRLAGMEHHLAEAKEPLPVVLDDLLVNFDDARAAAALQALSALGSSTQVLLFTHHQRVVELAERELDGASFHVVRLEPRRQDLPPVPPVPPAGCSEPAAEAPGEVKPDEDRSASERVLAALRASGEEALGKAELLERSGIADAQWPATIRALVGSGRLVQEGQRRGARYRLAPRGMGR